MKNLSSERQKFIITEFRKGRSIKGIAETIYYEIKTSDKSFTQKDARTEVEKVILADYLSNIKELGAAL